MGITRHITVLVLTALWLGCGPAHAEKRIALVIGNSAYKHVPKLANPVNDAALVAQMFRKAGFDEVTTKLDLTGNEMRAALRVFGAHAQDADVAVIYYAGHGMELDGNNYLIPIDATLRTDADVLDETLPLDRVLFAAEPAKQLRLIILDACRDNPFARTMKRTVASRGVGRGLAKVEPDAPNTMIAFAAKAGSTALDGDSKNGPFARALVDNLAKPGLDLRLAFGYVRDEVLKNTGYQQEPYVYGSLGGENISLVPAIPVAPKPNSEETLQKDYELALQLDTSGAWNVFLAHYPHGYYADLARLQLNKIAAEEARAAAEEKARIAEQEKARVAAERARKARQERASADAKAAEQAQLAAKAKAAERAAAANAAAAKPEPQKIGAEKPVAELAARQAANGASADAKEVASLSPPSKTTATSPAIDIVKSIQRELRRVGCLTDTVDGEWNAASQRSLALFNKYAGTRFDVRLASVNALEAIKAESSRVCPLACKRGFRIDRGRCEKIVCRDGYRFGRNGACDRIPAKKPDGAMQSRVTPRQDRTRPETSPAKRQASGQMFCDNQGCRPIRPGCHVEAPPYAGNLAERPRLVCN